MNLNGSKVTELADAVETHVKDGCHLSIGGFTINRNPMAAVYEIIRQKTKDIHLYAHSNGQGVDELVGADTRRLVLVPAVNPDVTIIHVQRADYRGNSRIEGLTFADVEQAKAARRLIITCEELIDDDYLKD